jgi:hypothetical protein
MRTVAALYVDPRGPYPKLEGVDCWDEQRDARLYEGPHPVVAHPPCGPWGDMKHLCTRRFHERDCAPIAIAHVQRFGGVLEHPQGSGLWAHARLPKPYELPDEHGGYTIHVEQVAWGHPCRKPTWLYVVGVPLDAVLAGIRSGGTITHWVGGSRGRGRTRQDSPIPHGIKAASAEIRRRTPVAFAEWLVQLARASSLAALLLLTGCPAQTLDTERTADCCEVTDGGPCEWTLVRYEAHRYAGPLASDEDACRALGLEPWQP